MNSSPLILTISFHNNQIDYFTQLRTKYFPAERNFINAHLTLFHALPNDPIVTDTLKIFCASQSAFNIRVITPVSIGNGVAFKLESFELMSMHKKLQTIWLEHLSLQDRHKIWPHITVQNKVGASESKPVLEELKSSFSPFEIKATGVELWEYLNGPWKFVDRFYFEAG